MEVSYTDYSRFVPFWGHMSLTRMSMSRRATTISRKLSSRFSPRLLVRSMLMVGDFQGCWGSAVVPCSTSVFGPRWKFFSFASEKEDEQVTSRRRSLTCRGKS